MKKVLVILLVLIIALSAAACSGAEVAPSGTVGFGGTDFKADYEMVEGDIVADDAAVEFFGGEGNGAQQKPTAGSLTAGEWKDLENLEFWQNLLRKNDWYAYMEARNLYTDKISVVSVKDDEQNPCFNAKVELLDTNGAVLYTARTDIAGNAYLMHDLNKQGNVPEKLRVNGIEQDLAEGVTNITLEGGTEAVTKLDLMLTVDTTGSMMDELSYLQAELEDVIKRVSSASDNVLSIRVSVNFYRDTGDEYVVRPFEFTEDVNKAIEDLNAQHSDGGGDYPEAVHTALKNSVTEHQWRDDAVKLMFFVLDAPPHSESEIKGINAEIQSTVCTASAKGIRIIPVASSGVDTETEFLLRSYAAMTGGTYLFLTNHSGIGGDHLEPTIGEYEVEAFNDCMVRVISEYCGFEYKTEQ